MTNAEQKTKENKITKNGKKTKKTVDVRQVKKDNLRKKYDERKKRKEEKKVIQNLNDLDHKQIYGAITKQIDGLRAEKNQVDSHAKEIDVVLQDTVRNVQLNAQNIQGVNKRIDELEETLDMILEIVLEEAEEKKEEESDEKK